MVKLWRLVLYEPEGQSNRRISDHRNGSWEAPILFGADTLVSSRC